MLSLLHRWKYVPFLCVCATVTALMSTAFGQAKIDLRPNSITATSQGTGQLIVDVQYSSLVGGQAVTPSLTFDVLISVNNSPVWVQSVTQTLVGFIPACYSSSPPSCPGSCPPGVTCVFVDLPFTMFDYCACDWIGSLFGISVPGNPGDQVTVTLDATNLISEVVENNNTLSTTAVAAVPTMSEWGLILFTTLIMVSGFLCLRMRERSPQGRA